MSMFLSVVMENGEVPESLDDGAGAGKALASRLDELDRLARGSGCRPLAEFVVDYAAQIDEILGDEALENDDLEEAIQGVGDGGPWYEPDEGSRTVAALIQSIEQLPGDQREALEDAWIALRDLASELHQAKLQHTRFHLALES